MPSMALHVVEFTFARGFDSFRWGVAQKPTYAKSVQVLNLQPEPHWIRLAQKYMIVELCVAQGDGFRVADKD